MAHQAQGVVNDFASSKPQLTKQQKETLANAMADFFFNYFKTQNSCQGGEVAALASGSTHRGGSPVPRVAT